MFSVNSNITKQRTLPSLNLVEIMLLNCKSTKRLSVKSIKLLTTRQICAKIDTWCGITERGAEFAYHC